MNWNDFPWKDGVSTVLACILLKILWDLAYRKIPRGMRGLRVTLDKAVEKMQENHSEAMAELQAQQAASQKVLQTQAELLARKCKGGTHQRKKRKPAK